MKKIFTSLFLFILLFTHYTGYCSLYPNDLVSQGFGVSVYRDVSNKDDIKQVQGKKFEPTDAKIFNFGLDKATYWIKLNLKENHHYVNRVLFID